MIVDAVSWAEWNLENFKTVIWKVNWEIYWKVDETTGGIDEM